MENVKRIHEETDGLFWTEIEGETLFLLANTQFNKETTWVNKKSIKLRLTTVEKETINGTEYKNVSIVAFDDIDQIEKDFLFDTLTSIYLNKDNLIKDIGEIYEVLFALVEYIRNANREEIDKQKGLIGELLTIHYLNNIDENIPGLASGKTNARFDIAIDDETKIEVKSTTSENREHTFGIKQLVSRDNIYISSVLLEQDDRGMSLGELFSENLEIFSKIPNEKRMEISAFVAVTNKVENTFRFNLERTYKNIKFFDSKRIVEENIKDGLNNDVIKEVKLSLSNLDEFDIESIFK